VRLGSPHEPETALPRSVIEVLRCRRITPRMQRVTFGGPDVARFAPACPDQHVKLFFPRRPGGPIQIPVMPDDGDVARWYSAYLQMPDGRATRRKPEPRCHRLREQRDHGQMVVSRSPIATISA
jgi:NADPH-dependent ferric siderophore reductase